MAKLSMTDFVEIISRAGTPKATKVKEVKNRPDYHPSADYYKPLREELANCHKNAGTKDRLKIFLGNLSDVKKFKNYDDVIRGYSKWWGKKTLNWFVPPSELYSWSDVQIIVNPELGLEIDGQRYLVKLYFKSDPLSKFRVEIATHLMELALRKKVKAEDKMVVLDIRNSKVIGIGGKSAELTAILMAEMAYISALWPSL